MHHSSTLINGPKSSLASSTVLLGLAFLMASLQFAETVAAAAEFGVMSNGLTEIRPGAQQMKCDLDLGSLDQRSLLVNGGELPFLGAANLPAPLAEGSWALPGDRDPYAENKPPHGWFVCGDPDTWWDIHAQARAYGRYDIRVEWSGMESTCGAEGSISPSIWHRLGDSELSLQGDFFLNQPVDRNILSNNAWRRSYAANFQYDTFEIAKLQLCWKYNDFAVTLGKMDTPFGRTYFPLFTNSRMDAPFIRSDVISWWQTGVMASYHKGPLVTDVAVTNDSVDRDTNSSKALIARVGLEDQQWALGASIKLSDGDGSEMQKEYNRYAGCDAMRRWGAWTLSGEVIFDEYGFRHPGFDPNNIFWGRSIYYRDGHNVRGGPLTGIGYYVNVGYQAGPWTGMFDYGTFFPLQDSSDPQQKIIIRRGICKVAYAFSPRLRAYGMILDETAGFIAQGNQPRKGYAFLSGLEFGI